MGSRQSTYLCDVDEPQPKRIQAPSAPESNPPVGAPRPPPLNVSAPPAGPRRRAPFCSGLSGLDTVDIATTHPHSPIQSPSATGLVDVWIIAGQSNAVGYNSDDGAAIPAAAQPLPGMVLSYSSSGAWCDAAPNVHSGIHSYTREPSCGPAMAFGRTLVALGLSGRVGLVPTAKGASSLCHDWRPTGGGELYGTMIARTKAALAAPLPGGGAGRLRGMIWIQGEADAEERHGPGPAEAYAANFTAFAQAVRRDLSSYHVQLPIIMGVMATRKRDCFPYIAAVRNAQLGLVLPGLLRVDLEGYEFFEEYGGYHVHLTKDGCAALGTAMAHAYYSMVVRAGLPRRPRDAVVPVWAHMPSTGGAVAAAVAVERVREASSSGGGGGGGGGGSLGEAGGGGGGGSLGEARTSRFGTEPAAEPSGAASIEIACGAACLATYESLAVDGDGVEERGAMAGLGLHDPTSGVECGAERVDATEGEEGMVGAAAVMVASRAMKEMEEMEEGAGGKETGIAGGRGAEVVEVAAAMEREGAGVVAVTCGNHVPSEGAALGPEAVGLGKALEEGGEVLGRAVGTRGDSPADNAIG